MELTGIAGKIIGILVLITSYSIVILGLFCAWSWIMDYLIRLTLDYFNMYDAFRAFVWERMTKKKKQ